MQFNDRERKTEDVAKCEDCGSGYTADERMNFEGETIDSIIESAYSNLTQIQLSMMTVEVQLEKLLQLRRPAGAPC
jgi:hypothetical protein